MDDGQRGDNINRMKVYRFESCPDYLGLGKASYRKIT